MVIEAIPIWAILLMFVIMILLPWFGGLVLIAINFHFAFKNLQFLTNRVESLRNDNDKLSAKIVSGQDELSSVNLRLQAVMIENAMLGSRRDDKNQGSIS